MSKYSILVTSYNKEKYIKKCINSILNQTYGDFELIIIDDGSTDTSLDIVNEYVDSRISVFVKENGGVSSTRNYALDKINSDYFMFVDADDYLEKDALEIIDQNNNGEDVISFNIGTIDKKILSNKCEFSNISGEDAIVKLINESTCFDTPVGYLYKTSYFLENEFVYKIGLEHEDFGLTPLIITKAKKISSIKDILYIWEITPNSITRNNNYYSTKKRAFDMIKHFDFLYEEIYKLNINSNNRNIFNSFLANCLLNKLTELRKEDRKIYVKELKKRNISKLLLSNTLNRKLKKLIISISINLYISVFIRRRV